MDLGCFLSTARCDQTKTNQQQQEKRSDEIQIRARLSYIAATPHLETLAFQLQSTWFIELMLIKKPPLGIEPRTFSLQD